MQIVLNTIKGTGLSLIGSSCTCTGEKKKIYLGLEPERLVSSWIKTKIKEGIPDKKIVINGFAI